MPKDKKLIYTHLEVGLNPKKNDFSPEINKDLYGTDGFINLGTLPQFRANALNMARKLLVNRKNTALYFIPRSDEKCFVVWANADGEIALVETGYFDYAADVFKKFNYDKDVETTGLFVETLPLKWEIIVG